MCDGDAGARFSCQKCPSLKSSLRSSLIKEVFKEVFKEEPFGMRINIFFKGDPTSGKGNEVLKKISKKDIFSMRIGRLSPRTI